MNSNDLVQVLFSLLYHLGNYDCFFLHLRYQPGNRSEFQESFHVLYFSIPHPYGGRSFDRISANSKFFLSKFF